MEIIPKRPWAHPDPDRRKKDGSIGQRKDLSIAIKEGRRIQHREWDKFYKFERHAFILGVCLLLALVMICVFCKGCHAFTQAGEIKAVIGEAEGESIEGKTAVACAINNRSSLKGVYGLHAPRVRHHLYSEKVYLDSAYAVEKSHDPVYCLALINGAQYWEGTAFPEPIWAKSMVMTAEIGHQRFYREDK